MWFVASVLFFVFHVVNSQSTLIPHCSQLNGEYCIHCEPGWWGIMGVYGLNNCDNKCPDSCLIGHGLGCYYEGGIVCPNCKPGYSGVDCSQSCKDHCDVINPETCPFCNSTKSNNDDKNNTLITVGFLFFVGFCILYYCRYRCRKCRNNKTQDIIIEHGPHDEYHDDDMIVLDGSDGSNKYEV